MRPVDSHCHLQFEQFDKDREKVVEEVEETLEFAVIAGTDSEDNKEVMNLAEKSESLEYCLGLHPLYFEDSSVEKVEDQIKSNSPVAIGEIGLDYNYITGTEEREMSEKIFRKMLEIAESEELPVVVHSRNAERKCFEIVEEYNVRGFFHCFNGTPELANEISEAGHMVGVTAQVLDSTRVKNIVQELSLDTLLTETDSPYLGPEKRNTPLNVVKVVEKIAEIKGLEVSEVAETTSENSREFFK